MKLVKLHDIMIAFIEKDYPQSPAVLPRRWYPGQIEKNASSTGMLPKSMVPGEIFF